MLEEYAVPCPNSHLANPRGVISEANTRSKIKEMPFQASCRNTALPTLNHPRHGIDAVARQKNEGTRRGIDRRSSIVIVSCWIEVKRLLRAVSVCPEKTDPQPEVKR